MIDFNFTNKNKPNFFMKWKLAYLYAIRIIKNAVLKSPPKNRRAFFMLLQYWL